MTIPVFPVIPTTQKYDWGMIGLSSKVAQFANAAKTPGFILDEKAPYAEVSRALVIVIHDLSDENVRFSYG